MPAELLRGLAELKKSDELEQLQQLAADGQHPDCLVISCMDSRCNPATIFHAAIGKFFAHAPMGAIVPPKELQTGPSELKAKLKYAIDIDQLI